MLWKAKLPTKKIFPLVLQERGTSNQRQLEKREAGPKTEDRTELTETEIEVFGH